MKNFNLDKSALKDIVYGSLAELVKNRKYYHHSSVGAEYSHLTEEGEKVFKEFISFYGHLLIDAEKKDLDKRAKEMVIGSLKGENN